MVAFDFGFGEEWEEEGVGERSFDRCFLSGVEDVSRLGGARSLDGWDFRGLCVLGFAGADDEETSLEDCLLCVRCDDGPLEATDGGPSFLPRGGL